MAKEPPLLDDGDTVGEIGRFAKVVGDVKDRQLVAALETFEGAHDAVAQGGVDGAEGLVQQQQPGAGHQAAGQGDPLPLPTGEPGDPPLQEIADLQKLQQFGEERFVTLSAEAVGEADVRLDVEMGEEGVILEDESDLSAMGREGMDRLLIQKDTPRFQGKQPRDRFEELALTSAGAAEDDAVLSRLHRQIQPLDGESPLSPGEPFQSQSAHGRSLSGGFFRIDASPVIRGGAMTR